MIGKRFIGRCIFAFASLSLFFMLGCSESVSSGDQLPTGTLVGNVVLYKAMIPQTNNAGVTVTLEEIGRSTTTDEFGEFRFDDLPTRTYTIRYEKDGFGIMKQPMITFVGGSVLRAPNTYLLSTPTCGSIFDDIRQIDTSYIEAYAHATCSEHDSDIAFVNENLLFVFSNSREVSADPAKHQFAMMGQSPQPRGTATIFVAKQQLDRYLNMDDSIYVAAYNTSGAYWTDPLTQRAYYSGHHPDRDRTLAFKWRNH
jgi:hypothetical protein